MSRKMGMRQASQHGNGPKGRWPLPTLARLSLWALLGLLVFASGCETMAQKEQQRRQAVRAQITNLAKKNRFDEARALKIPTGASMATSQNANGLMFKTPEELEKEWAIANIVRPEEEKYITRAQGELDRLTGLALQGTDDEEAFGLEDLFESCESSVSEAGKASQAAGKAVANYFERVIKSRILDGLQDKMTADVEAALARNDFDRARDSTWEMLLTTGQYLPAATNLVEQHGAQLRNTRINPAQYVYATNLLTRKVATYVKAKDYDGARSFLASQTMIRSYPGAMKQLLADTRRSLEQSKMPQDSITAIQACVENNMSGVFANLAMAVRTADKPDLVSFEKVLAAISRQMGDYLRTPQQRRDFLDSVRQCMGPVVQEAWQAANGDKPGEYTQLGITALNRQLEVFRADLQQRAVDEVQAASRVHELMEQVKPMVASGKLDEAREAIYAYGVTGVQAVDRIVFEFKCGLLNSRVNTACLESVKKTQVAQVERLIEAQRYDEALEVITAFPWYGSLPGAATEALDATIRDAVGRGARQPVASSLVHGTRLSIDDMLSRRPGALAEENAEIDMTVIDRDLRTVAATLFADDLEADGGTASITGVAMLDLLRAGMLAELGRKPEGWVGALTTKELNDAIHELQAELFERVRGRMDKDIDAQTLAKILQAVNLSERIAGFVGAIEQPRHPAGADASEAYPVTYADPDLRAVLGEGARLLRRQLAGERLTRAEATSLFVAAAVMGYDDIMNLAGIQGSQLDGASAKDQLKRPAYLLTLQYGVPEATLPFLRKASHEVMDANGHGAVYYAVSADNADALRQLLTEKVDARCGGAEGVTPIMRAASMGKTRFVLALLSFSDLDAQDGKGRTALHHAVLADQPDIVRSLVLAHADVGITDNEGDGVLEHAFAVRSTPLLKYFLDTPLGADQKPLAPTARVVFQAVAAGDTLAVRMFVDHGAAVTDSHLARAVRNMDLAMVQYLVSLGLDVNAQEVLAQAEALVAPDGTVKKLSPRLARVIAFLRSQGARI